MKKTAGFLLTAALALTTMAGSASAFHAPVNWVTVATDTYTMNGDSLDVRRDKTVEGIKYGGYQIAIPAHLGSKVSGTGTVKTLLIKVYEDDFGASSDEYVASFLVHPDGYNHNLLIPNVSDWVDGGNGEAEFYTTHQTDYVVDGGGGYLRGIEYWD